MINQCKIILLGDSGVGKSSLMTTFLEQKDKYNSSTIGVDFGSKTISYYEKKIKLLIWDTAGQEMYLSITRNYFRNVDVAILVYSIDSMDSFTKINFNSKTFWKRN